MPAIAHLALPPWTPPPHVGEVGTPRLRAVPSGPAAGAWLRLVLHLRPDPEADVGEVAGGTVGEVTVGEVAPRTHTAELTVEVDPGWRGRGLATEALRHVLSAALSPQADGGWGLRRLEMRCAASDAAARGVAQRLGVRREVRSRQDRWEPGVGLDDTLGWGVLAEEWDVRAHRPTGDRRAGGADVGVGPHPTPWPDDPRLDRRLLRDGDRRNVADRYRYWTVEAIATDLRARSHPFHVAIENWRHDLNIGTVVRNANAFGARAVHVVGRRRWNRRGAMVTDRYLDVHHHPDIDALAAQARRDGLVLVGIDNLPGSTSLLSTALPRACVLLFGQEGPGLSDEARRAASAVLHVPQVGSTRSINAGVASGIAMAAWLAQHAGTR